MGFFSLYIIIMSDDDEDYLDDPEILDFNENLDARAAQAQEEHDPSDAFGLEMFGPTGRGSPAMGRQSPYQLSRNAAASLRRVGFKDEKHLKDTTAWEPQPQPRKQEKAVVKAEVRPIVKARPPQQYRNQFSDNDENAQAAADKFWLRMGHLPLRHRVGEEYEKMMQERSRPQRNKGGTRKRSRGSRKSIKRNTKKRRSTKKRSSRHRNKSRK